MANFYQLLVNDGWSPVQAAALAGNMQQESSFNPSAFNKGEGAHGLIQWRLDRLSNLDRFAQQMGTDRYDPLAQVKFIRHEMNTTERGPGMAFMSAKNLNDANRAAKGYIRYGDNSYNTRLNNAQRILQSEGGGTDAHDLGVAPVFGGARNVGPYGSRATAGDPQGGVGPYGTEGQYDPDPAIVDGLSDKKRGGLKGFLEALGQSSRPAPAGRPMRLGGFSDARGSAPSLDDILADLAQGGGLPNTLMQRRTQGFL